MIDIEYQIIDRLRNKLQEINPDIYVPQEYIQESAIFPTVTCYELNNTDIIATSTKNINHYNLMYQIDIYTTGQTKKSDSKEIQKVVYDFFTKELGMTKRTGNTVENLNDLNIYRYVMRFEGILDIETLKIYRRY